MKNKKTKISVIVPVYNSEKHLNKCLDSLICQTYENLEIICVNDGSTDSSTDILEAYKKRDNRIKVYEQPHKGPSCARNYGITAATGEYISFVDSDDWVLLALYDLFVKLNEGKNADIFIFNAESYREDSPDVFNKKFFLPVIWKNHHNDETIHTFSDCSNPFFGNLSACNKIYNLHFLRRNNIRFIENTAFEGNLFHLESILQAKSILVTNETLYRYRLNSLDSIVNLSDNKIFDVFKILDEIESLFKKNNLYDEYKYGIFQLKYELLNNVFKGAGFAVKPKFYEKMQEYLKNIDMSEFDLNICTQLNDFNLYRDILRESWAQHSLGKRFPDELKPKELPV